MQQNIQESIQDRTKERLLHNLRIDNIDSEVAFRRLLDEGELQCAVAYYDKHGNYLAAGANTTRGALVAQVLESKSLEDILDILEVTNE